MTNDEIAKENYRLAVDAGLRSELTRIGETVAGMEARVWNEAIEAAAKWLADRGRKAAAFDCLSLKRPTQGKDTEG